MANEQTEKKMDIELENPADFTSPEELYKDLIRSIRKYHPSGCRCCLPRDHQRNPRTEAMM